MVQRNWENEDWCNDAFYLSGLKTYWCQTLTEHQYLNHAYYLHVHLTQNFVFVLIISKFYHNNCYILYFQIQGGQEQMVLPEAAILIPVPV